MEVRHGLAGDARAARVAVDDARHAIGEAALARLLGDGDESAVQIAEGRLAAAEREAARLEAALTVLRGRVPAY
jgi:hypothetical protein